MTVLETIQKSADFLSKKGVESPRLQAELLLAHVLKLPRMKLYLNFERQLSDKETNVMRECECVKRRGQREPLQHILGSTSFCGLEIIVNRHVLVPRPETELLTEAGWEFLSTVGSQSPTVLDFGTGSGCIAIALAVKCSICRVTALEASQEALEIAKQNAAQNQVGDRMDFIKGDKVSALPSDSRFDLIISNPPYIPSAEIASLQPEVRDFDPRAALDGGVDGLDFHRMFAEKATSFLSPDGRIMLEFGDGQAEVVKAIFMEQKWIVEAIKEDYSRQPRILIARSSSCPPS